MSRVSFLDVATAPSSADAIFVFAGRQGRKHYGVELYRAGYAPRLVLSVGRFEWRRFPALGLPSDGGLTERVAAIEPRERHFFVDVTAERVTTEWIPKGRLGTMTEARAIAERLPSLGVERLLVVSSREHLPRCALSVRAFLTAPCELIPVASPPGEPAPRPAAARAREWAKLGAYSSYLAVQRLVRGFP